MSQPSRLGDEVRRLLALGERAVREVPQRPLPRDRLVDDPALVDLADEGRVGRRHHPAVEGELAGQEALLDHGPSAGPSGRVAAAEAVRPDAEVALGVDRVAAERAVGAAGLDHELGPLHERPRAGRPRAGPGRPPPARRSSSSSSSAVSVSGKTSITIRAMAGSQDRVIVPARNCSSIGCSSGSESSRPDRGDGRDQGRRCRCSPSPRRGARRCARRARRPAASPARR